MKLGRAMRFNCTSKANSIKPGLFMAPIYLLFAYYIIIFNSRSISLTRITFAWLLKALLASISDDTWTEDSILIFRENGQFNLKCCGETLFAPGLRLQII